MKKKNPYATLESKVIFKPKKSPNKEPRADSVTSNIDMRVRVKK